MARKKINPMPKMWITWWINDAQVFFHSIKKGISNSLLMPFICKEGFLIPF